MPDISMCMNKSCPSKDTCYRFTASPNVWRQSYMDFKVAEGLDKCKSYWQDARTEQEKKQDEERYNQDLAAFHAYHSTG